MDIDAQMEHDASSLMEAVSPLSVEASELEVDTFGTFDPQLDVVRPTPQHWTVSRALRTPTSAFSRTCVSNASSITCMKYNDLRDSSERQALSSAMKETPLRDMMPDDPEQPSVLCPMSVDSVMANNLSEFMDKENQSPQPAQVLSPATAFRMKRAIFESSAQAVKSPARRTRARNVSAFDVTPTTTAAGSCPGTGTTTVDTVSPNSAIASESGVDHEHDARSPVAAALLMEAKQVDEDVQGSLVDVENVEDVKCVSEVLVRAEPDVAAVKETAPCAMMLESSNTGEVLSASKPAPVVKPLDTARPTQHTNWMRVLLLACGAALVVILSLCRLYSSPVTALPTGVTLSAPTVVQPSYEPYGSDSGAASHVAVPDAGDAEATGAVLSESTEVLLLDSGAMVPDEGGSLQQDISLLLADLRTILYYHLAGLQERLGHFMATHHVPERLQQLQRHVQPALSQMATSVLSFHHAYITPEVRDELATLQARILSKAQEVQNGLLSARDQLYEKVPFLSVLERALVEGSQAAQRQMVQQVQQTHHFLKERELLPEVYVAM